jgi:hypothetical protein
MIATGFRSVGWVASVAAAALGCYLVSQRVASERAGLERLDRQVLEAKLDIRKLKTELDTRSRMPVLEGWNRDVLALSAPAAQQFLDSSVQLARYEVRVPSEQPKIEPVAYKPDPAAPAAPAPIVQTVSAPAAAVSQPPLLRHANFVKPVDAGDAPVRSVALLDDHVMASIDHAARNEGDEKTLKR